MRKLVRFLMRPAVAYWGTIGLLVIYPLSLGPAAWLLYYVRMPASAALGIEYFYCPLLWGVNRSQTVTTLVYRYQQLWVDFSTGQPASPSVAVPEAPPFFVELSGTLVAAWLIWNFVRLVNQGKTSKSGCQAPKAAP